MPPIPAEAFSVNSGDLDWVNRQCTMQPLATFQKPIHLTGGIARMKKITFILANGWSPSPFPPFYERAKVNGWKTLTMSCGHDVMSDLPDELTQELLAGSPRSALSAL